MANGIVLPFLLFYMLKLVNREDLMGHYRNTRFANAIAWTTSIVMIILNVAMIWTTVRGS